MMMSRGRLQPPVTQTSAGMLASQREQLWITLSMFHPPYAAPHWLCIAAAANAAH